MNEPKTDFDSPWKDILERYFQEFIQFFFPAMYAEVDWACGYEFLDKELQQIVRDAELGRRLVDKLIKVFTREDEEKWVLVHVEVQGQHVDEFSRRMYVYNYRIFDRYDRDVVTLAVLSDDDPDWRPNHFGYDRWGCKVSLEYPLVKLLDYETRQKALEENDNPFAMIVLSHLKTLRTRRDPELRFQWKVSLVKQLYERGFSREDILELARFIDWIMVLPKELEQRFETAIAEYEEEKKMQYVTTWERRGIEQGVQQGVQQGLQQGIEQGRELGELIATRDAVVEILRARFAQVPSFLIEALKGIKDRWLLRDILKQAAIVQSLEEFQHIPELQQRS
jgi:flagellar biosynthesis/type III secretory pathway protein FliH